MKKIVTLFLLLSILICTTLFTISCSNEYIGTWTVHGVTKNGESLTISELEDMGDYSLSDLRIEIKGNGEAYIYQGGSGSSFKWEKTANGIKIGVRELPIENGYLVMTNNGVSIYLSK